VKKAIRIKWHIIIAANVHGWLPAVEFKNFSRWTPLQMLFLFMGEASTMQAGSKPHVVRSRR